MAPGETPVQRPILKVENFAKDPQWEGRNNHIVSPEATIVTQDFGYSATHFAGKEEGEMGGRIQGASVPASYSDTIPVKSLDDSLSASGAFAVKSSTAGAGVFIGYFNSQQPGGTETPVASLGLHLDFESSGGRLAIRLVTCASKSCGVAVASAASRAASNKPNLPIKNDGTRYQWNLRYDPRANGGYGRVQFIVKGDGAKHEPFEGQFFSFDLPSGFKKEGAKFDRFGMMNRLSPGGGAVTIYCDDLQFDGRTEDFGIDPDWINRGNRFVFEDREHLGAQNFGYNPGTSIAGGASGEVGGVFWRTSASWAQYADSIDVVDLSQPLEATGKVTLVSAAPDSEMYIGWFSSTDVETPPAQGKNFLGVHVGGSAKAGNSFAPAYATKKGTTGTADKAPVLLSGRSYNWSLSYDPVLNRGNGEISVTLGDETTVLPLRAGHQREGGRFDRFGIFTGYPGGGMIRIYLDDLVYSVGGQVELTKGGLGKN